MPVSLYGVHTKSIPSQSFSILIKADSSAFSFEARATISRITSSFDCKPASRAFSKVRMEEVLVSGDGDGVLNLLMAFSVLAPCNQLFIDFC